MYTIKINTFDVSDIKGVKERKFKGTYYVEGSSLQVKMFDSSQDDFQAEIEKLHVYWEVNPKKEKFIMCKIGYVTSKDEYEYLIIYNNADIFLLQNGKTIDKISV